MRLNRAKDQQRGDTIVEVLFAVAVFAMVAVGTLTIMNQAISTAQRALEVTLVRQQIDAQAEAIRYIHQAYVAAYQKNANIQSGTAGEWKKMTDPAQGKGARAASNFGTVNGTRCLDNVPGEKPFLLNARTARIWSGQPAMVAPQGASLPPFAQIIYANNSSIERAYGLWVEAIPSTLANQTGFVDFHIRACWESAGSSAPVTLGTVVRLYEPR